MTNTNEISKSDVQNYEITLQDIIDLLDKKYELIYVDYRDSLDDSLDKIQDCIHKQQWDSLYETTDEWFWESQDNSIDYIKKELISEICREYETERYEAEEILEKYWEDVREVIYERDISNPIKDLIRNTSEPVMFYDTGVEIYDGCLSDQKEVKEMIKEIKKALKIKLSETKWDNQIDMMIRQGDNGRLVIYFTADINQMMDLKDKNVVEFSNPNIAIIDTWNGAGDDCRLIGHEFTIPFNIENFFIDKLIKYNYTYAVCGMSSHWCEGTGVSFKTKKVSNPKAFGLKSTLHQEKEREDAYIKTFQEGKCTFGDMDMRRHRNTYYLNEFPCGIHCPNCHNFWVD